MVGLWSVIISVDEGTFVEFEIVSCRECRSAEFKMVLLAKVGPWS